MNQALPSPPLKHGRVKAIFTKRDRIPSGTIPCIIDRDLILKPELVCLQLYQEPHPLIKDLARLAGVVAYADRMITRTTAKVWGREIEISLPVSNPDHWNDKDVKGKLTGALDLVTGDLWHVTFYPLPASHDAINQTTIKCDYPIPPIIIPYSDGLDSYAARRIEADANPGTPFILVTVGHEKHAGGSGAPKLPDDQCRHWFPFQLRYRKRDDRYKFRESSFRSRAFAYTVMAGAIAYLTNAQRIVVPESGQGILGPWLMRVGNEAPDIRTHPLFTRRIEEFLHAILGIKLTFYHPRLFHTKAETLRDAGLKHDPGWLHTRSCPRDQRDISIKNHGLLQCGVCSACLLRRMSIFAAGLEERAPYYWNDLHASSLDTARLQGSRDASRNDLAIAMAGVVSHIQLAEYLESSLGKQHIAQATQDLAELLGRAPELVEPQLRGLLMRHRNEWNEFVAEQGPDSFIMDWWSSIKC